MATEVSERFVWLSGEIINVNEAKVNMLSPTAQFGLNVFEGIPCYWSGEIGNIFAFRLRDHYERLGRSARMLQIDFPYSYESVRCALSATVKANEYREDLAARIIVYVEGFGSWGAEGPVGMLVAPIPRRNTSVEYNKHGLKCCVSTWRRISDNVLSPHIKCGANYINSRMANREAARNGYDTAVFLNEAGKVAEGTGSCLFVLSGGVLKTPKLSDGVLSSITRKTILEISGKLSIACVEDTIDRTELYTADEAFFCGSSMGITPITAIDGFEYKKPYKITAMLQKEYMNMVRGKIKGYETYLEALL